MNSNRLGDYTEIKAALWLMKQGYEVFRNLGCTGPVDIIALDPHTGETVLIDVKFQKGNRCGPPIKDEQVEIGVRKLNVSDDRIWFDVDRSII